MNRAKLRLFVTAVLFVGWLGWLAYLALVKPRPVVVSRAQILAATHAVVAKLTIGADGRPTGVVIEEVVHGPEPRTGLKAGATLPLANLGQAKFVASKPSAREPFLLLLEREHDGYVLAAVPRSPGHEAGGQPLIYPWRPDVERQVRELMR